MKSKIVSLLLSSILMGTLSGADGSSYGDYPHIRELSEYPNVHIHTSCPEEYIYGTPKEIPDIEGGNWADVLY